MRVHPLVWLFLQTGMTIPTIIFETSAIYLFLGLNPNTWSKYGGNLVGAVSIAAIQMVFIYQSPWWRKLLAKNVTIVNFCVFAIANFALTFVDYFFELGVIMLITGREFQRASIGVILHQQLVFFTYSFNAGWFAGHNVIPGNAFTKSVFWYLVSWIVWIPFSIPVMDNTSYIDSVNYTNTYLCSNGFIAALNFVNLMRLNVLKYIPYEFKDVNDQIGIVGFFSIVGAFCNWGVIYGLWYAITGTTSSGALSLKNDIGNQLSVLWIAQAIVGETTAEWSWGLIKRKKRIINIALFIIINSILTWVVYVALAYIYHYFIYDVFFRVVFKYPDGNWHSKQDYIFGFGVGNLYLVWNGLKFFSKGVYSQLAAQAKKESESVE